MTYQAQSLGSFAEPREVNRTSQWYKESPSSAINIKRKQHALFEERFNQYLRGRNGSMPVSKTVRSGFES